MRFAEFSSTWPKHHSQMTHLPIKLRKATGVGGMLRQNGGIMKKLFISGIALTALVASPAIAADMPVKYRPPPPPIFSWAGCTSAVTSAVHGPTAVRHSPIWATRIFALFQAVLSEEGSEKQSFLEC